MLQCVVVNIAPPADAGVVALSEVTSSGAALTPNHSKKAHRKQAHMRRINVEVRRDAAVLLVGVASSGTAINNRGCSYAGNAVESVNSLSTVC